MNLDSKQKIDLPLRVFLGIPPEAAFLTQLDRAKTAWNLPGREIPLENLHLTIEFLGNLTAEKLASLSNQLKLQEYPPAFELTFDRLRVKSAQSGGRIYWIEANPNDALSDLRRLIHKCLSVLEIPFQLNRKFRPHITLSRSKHSDPKINGFELEDPIAFKAGRLAIYQSRLSSEGATYEILNTIDLK